MPNQQVVFYDLGMTPSQIDYIKSVDGVEYRRFPFENYPSYFDVKVNAGEYAWKPAIINLCLEEAENVVWMDSGDTVQGSLQPVVDYMNEHGFYAGSSSGSMRSWVHPGTVKYLKAPDSIMDNRNCNACFMGFNRKLTKDTLAKDFLACAMVKDCIAPPGSSRSNHRQDQSVITLLTLMSDGKFDCGRPEDFSLYNYHVEYKWECRDPLLSFAVGVPSSLQLVDPFIDRMIDQHSLAPTSKLLAAEVAVVLSTHLAFDAHAGPRILVVGSELTHALQQLVFSYKVNTELFALSSAPPSFELLRVLKSSTDAVAAGDASLVTMKSHDDLPVKYLTLPPKQSAALTDAATCKLVYDSLISRGVNGIVLLDTSAEPMDLAKQLHAFEQTVECGEHLLSMPQRWFVIWNAHGSLPSSEPLVPYGAQHLVISDTPTDHIVIYANFPIPSSILALESQSAVLHFKQKPTASV